ncbi:MAG: tRNA (cytidine(34)-2'-O)-methyltransferase, partial [Oscillospiraceae bacterium]|nr:tRNA (cytidine(34)-2'-O)-methyltransferase [Oscillospiraceae bacterium]
VTGARLHIVLPMKFEVDDKHLKRAGLDYWHYLDITYYDNLADFFEKTNGEYYYFTTKGKHTYSDVAYKDDVYILFGREDAGLPEDLLYQNPETCVRIPMAGGMRSLNLSNSVAIAVYEILRQWNFPELQNFGKLTQYEWKD